MEPVRSERRGRVTVITIDRPEARNAINADVTAGMTKALDAAEGDREVRAVVVTGGGDKAFCAGMDLKAFASSGVEGIADPKGGFAGIATRDFPKPLIAAVNGHALAGGLEIVLSCDCVIAADTATFGLPEVKRGLLAAAGGPIRLPKRLPLPIALEIAMTGDAIDASRALTLGLVNKVVPREQVLDEAIALAERICENSPIAVRMARRLTRESVDTPEVDAWAKSNAYSAEVFRSGDAIEGATAFAEKRAPKWKSD
jgi:enoyl-CoA hydratase/carnithine racemase